MKAFAWAVGVVAIAFILIGISLEMRRPVSKPIQMSMAETPAPVPAIVAPAPAPIEKAIASHQKIPAPDLVSAPQSAAASPAPAIVAAPDANRASDANRVGVAAAVSGKVLAFAGSTGEGRALSSRAPLYVGDKIVTDARGQLQIMLLDETVFALGPNGCLILEKFAFNPSNDDGTVAARILSGSYRFSTGRIAHKTPANMTVYFPDSVLDVRGTIVTGNVGPNGTVAVLLGPGPNKDGERVGAFTLRTNAGSVDVDRPGFGSAVDPGSQRPSAPIHVSQSQLNNILGNLESKPKQDSASQKPEREAPESKTPIAKGLRNAGPESEPVGKLQATDEDIHSLSRNASHDHGTAEIEAKEKTDPGAAERAEAAERAALKKAADANALDNAKAAKEDADSLLGEADNAAKKAKQAADEADKAKVLAAKEAERAAQAANEAANNARAKEITKTQAEKIFADLRNKAEDAAQGAAAAAEAAKKAADDAKAAAKEADAAIQDAQALAKQAQESADKAHAAAQPLDAAAIAANAALKAAQDQASAAHDLVDQINQANADANQADQVLQDAQDSSNFDDPSTDPAVIAAQAADDAAWARVNELAPLAENANQAAADADAAAAQAQLDLGAAQAASKDADDKAARADGDAKTAADKAAKIAKDAAAAVQAANDLADTKSAEKKAAQDKADDFVAKAKAAKKDADDKAAAATQADADADKAKQDLNAAKKKAKDARQIADIADARARKAQAALHEAQLAADGAAEGLADAKLGNPIDPGTLTELLRDIAYWQQVREIESGTGQYAGGGDFKLEKCDGHDCANPKGSFKFVLNVDFGKRTYGGDCRGDCAPSGASFHASADNLKKGSVSDALTIPSASFSELNGPALIKARSASNNFSADIALKAVEDNPAGMAQAAVKYFDGKTKGSGIATAPLVDCAGGACKK